MFRSTLISTTICCCVLFLGLSFTTPQSAQASEHEISTVVELANRTQMFWQNISAIDVTYVYEDDAWDESTHTHHPRQVNYRWIADRSTNKEREWKEKQENNRSYYKQTYYNGESSFCYYGYDLTTQYDSQLEYYINEEKDQRHGTQTNGVNILSESGYYNSAYRSWFFNADYYFLAFNPIEEKDASFVDIVQKYPTSTLTEKEDKSGDVLYVFRIFPNKRAEELFPTEIKEEISYKEVVVNASKNYLVQYVKTVGYLKQANGESIRSINDYEVTDYIRVGELFFPKTTEFRIYAQNDALTLKHAVSSISLQVDSKDFESFHIPRYTEVTIEEPNPKDSRLAQWGPDDKPARVFSGDEEYIPYIEKITQDYYRQRNQNQRNSHSDKTVRIVLCIFGLALVAAAILLKRRNSKTKTIAEPTQD